MLLQQMKVLLQSAEVPSSELDLSSTSFLQSLSTIGDLHNQLSEAYRTDHPSSSTPDLFKEWCKEEKTQLCNGIAHC